MNKNTRIQEGRHSLITSSFAFLPGVLPILLFLSLLPAFLTLCTRGELPTDPEEELSAATGLEETGTQIILKSEAAASCLDVFFFNNDSLARLDSYQRIEAESPSGVDASSRSGSKILVVLANSSSDKYTWADVNSYDMLRTTMFELSEEDPETPVMSAECTIEETGAEDCSLVLEPLMSIVELGGISCDFSGRAYEGCELENVVVYLSNVNERCAALPSGEGGIEAMVNLGGLNEGDLISFLHPEMLLQTIDVPIGAEEIEAGLEFYCYPNTTEEDVAGSPYTRLVIEGTLDGETCYYPINVNRSDGGNGIERGQRYILNVYITKRGSSDPDTPLEAGSVTITVSVSGWEEMDDITIGF